MTNQTKAIIVLFLILATAMEVSGDAIIRNGIMSRVAGVRLLYFATGAVLLFGYGFSLNMAPIEFHRVAGIYIAVLFVMWQVVSFLAFRSVPNLSILLGGSLIVVGGLIVAFASA